MLLAARSWSGALSRVTSRPGRRSLWLAHLPRALVRFVHARCMGCASHTSSRMFWLLSAVTSKVQSLFRNCVNHATLLLEYRSYIELEELLLLQSRGAPCMVINIAHKTMSANSVWKILIVRCFAPNLTFLWYSDMADISFYTEQQYQYLVSTLYTYKSVC